MGEKNLEGLNGDGVGVEGVTTGDGGNPDDVMAALPYSGIGVPQACMPLNIKYY